jgi:hypothetical protein
MSLRTTQVSVVPDSHMMLPKMTPDSVDDTWLAPLVQGAITAYTAHLYGCLDTMEAVGSESVRGGSLNQLEIPQSRKFKAEILHCRSSLVHN